MPINPEKLKILAYWMLEREVIHTKKERGDSKPWTQDPILQSYRFCNVRREDDTVTKWFAANWRNERYWNEPNFVPAIILGRTINWPDTLDYIGFPHVWSRRYVHACLENLLAKGNKVWTGAYMITAGPTGVSKAEWVTGNADAYFKDADRFLKDRTGWTLEEVWRALQKYPCVGPFIAGQIVADLKYTPILGYAKDWNNWAPVGPGSRRGLNRLHDRHLKFPLTQNAGLSEMLLVRAELGRSDLCLHDIQNCLCEFDKYMRVKNNEGRPRATYPGAS